MPTRALLALGLLLATALPGAPASASLLTVAPEGGGGFQTITPFRGRGLGGSHVQQVYAAPLFAAFAGPRAITGFDLRTPPGAPVGGLFGNTLSVPSVRISLSTTQAGDETSTPLSTAFADNFGTDTKQVFNGALTLTTAQPGQFDFRITFQDSFVYDPSLGNLLLDVVVADTAQVSTNGLLGFAGFDDANAFNDGIYSVYALTDGLAARGLPSTDGAVTRFVSDAVAAQPVPEPASIAIFGAGLALLGLRRRS